MPPLLENYKLELTLPFPPSVNKRLAHARKQNRMFLSKVFKDYFVEVDNEVKRQLKFKNKTIDENINQIIIFHPPDRRIRDNDNYPKAINDGIKHAKVIQDDSLLRYTLLCWGDIVKGGCAKVRLGNFKFKAFYADGTEEII